MATKKITINELRSIIRQIIKEEQPLIKNIQNRKTILNLIFSENEISELHRIKNEIAVNYLNDLDIDPFSIQDEDDLISFIKNVFNKKGIKVDNLDMKNILDLVNNNIS
jgi:hypothetical protein